MNSDDDVLRRQYDALPYPNVPFERTCRDDPNALYVHSLMTAFYLYDRRIADPAGMIILDAGCGSGFKSQALAEANPGARIVGVDFSAESIAVARRRIAHHGIAGVEFHHLAIADLPELGLRFDYINCDEVLYLVPDPAGVLNGLKAVLKPGGILRGNLHSLLARAPFFRAQEAFRLLGIEQPGPREVNQIHAIMERLGENTYLKVGAWQPYWRQQEDFEWYVLNFLLQGDKGFTTVDLFELLAGAELELLGMTNGGDWDLTLLFDLSQPLPEVVAQILHNGDARTKLRLYELIQGNHRLLDFWCVPKNAALSKPPLFAGWTNDDYRSASIRLHPQLCTPRLKAALIESIEAHRPFDLNLDLNYPRRSSSILFQPEIAACLLPLWDSPQPLMPFIVEWLNLAGGEQESGVIGAIIKTIAECEQFAYFMVEK